MESKILKRRTLSLSEKIDIIRKFDAQYPMNKKEFAKAINIPESSLRTILRNRDDIEKHATTGSAKRKKVKAGKYENLEKILYEWFNEVRSCNMPINGPIIKEKAAEIAQRLEINFVPSNGWLDRFKNRHGIVYKHSGTEPTHVIEKNANYWKCLVLPEIAKTYSKSDIYNVDEIALLYKLTPDRSKMFQEEKCPGGEFSGDRVTILIGSNSDGTDKLKPLVIGKSHISPRCFKNVKTFPCDYESQNRAWMTSDIFVSWLREFDLRIGKACRRVVLFVDHCPAHPKMVPDLKNVRIEFLPGNSSSALQPMSQGISQSLRQNYRKRLIHRFLYETERRDFAVTLLDAIHFISAAWDDVDSKIICDSFKRAGITTNLDEEKEMDGPVGLPETDDYWRAMCEQLGTTWANLEDYIYVDEDIITSEVRSIDNIIDDVKTTTETKTFNGAEDAEEATEIEPEPAPSISSVMEAFTLVRCYASSLDDPCSEEIFRHINAAENVVMKHRLTMRNQVIDFFAT